MTNGSYTIVHKQLGTKYLLKVYNGSLRLHDPINDQFLRRINEGYLKEFYEVVEKLKAPTKLYNLEWIVAGKVKETINVGASYPVALTKFNELKRTSHRSGLLRIIAQMP